MRLIQIVAGIAFAGLVACSDRSQNPVTPEALEVGRPVTIFAASSRGRDPDGSFGVERSSELSLLELTVSIPPSHKPGELRFSYADPKPGKEFTLAGREVFASPSEFGSRVKETIRNSPSKHNELTIFVHGFNSTQVETAFRAAQLSHDVGLPGAVMIYSWPSLGKPLGYAFDNESAIFARDGLEQILRRARASGITRIVLVAHSMGSFLTMETLRQIEIKEPGWSASNLSGVVLISPDLDLDVFRAQIARLKPAPENFYVFVSGKDRILNLSQRLRGRQRAPRLGNLETLDMVADLPIKVIDTTAFANEAESSHFVAGTSPALISIFSSVSSLASTFGPDKVGLETLLPADIVHSQRATEYKLSTAN